MASWSNKNTRAAVEIALLTALPTALAIVCRLIEEAL